MIRPRILAPHRRGPLGVELAALVDPLTLQGDMVDSEVDPLLGVLVGVGLCHIHALPCNTMASLNTVRVPLPATIVLLTW